MFIRPPILTTAYRLSRRRWVRAVSRPCRRLPPRWPWCCGSRESEPLALPGRARGVGASEHGSCQRTGPHIGSPVAEHRNRRRACAGESALARSLRSSLFFLEGVRSRIWEILSGLAPGLEQLEGLLGCKGFVGELDSFLNGICLL